MRRLRRANIFGKYVKRTSRLKDCILTNTNMKRLKRSVAVQFIVLEVMGLYALNQIETQNTSIILVERRSSFLFVYIM